MPSKPTVREGIETFLKNRESQSPFLIGKWAPDLETQVMVYPGSNPVDETETKWTDGSEIWNNLRWPNNAGTKPQYTERTLTFSPATHVQLVGSTWWSYERLRSVGVGFDIDSKEGHAATTNTCDDDEIDRVIEVAKTLPYVTVVRSKSGKGVHIYVFFDENDQPETFNHNEHTQLALVVLERMCRDSGFDFNKYIDVKGVLFWLWSDSIGNNGFELVQDASAPLKAEDLGDWKAAHLAVPNRTIRVHGYLDSGEAVSDDMETGFDFHELDETHKQILKELEDLGWSFSWRKDFNMAHTHTAALLELFKQRQEGGRPLKGIYNTVSGGRDKSKPNCYISPRPNGVFRVCRFGAGATEHPTWETYEGKTYCFFNEEMPTMNVLRKFASKVDLDGKMTFLAKDLENALKALGATLGDEWEKINVPISVILNKSGVLVARFNGLLEAGFKEWQREGKGWMRDLPVVHNPGAFRSSQLELADKLARHIVGPQYQALGWAIREKSGQWIMHKTFDNLSCVLDSQFGKDAKGVRADMTMNPWRLVHEPFSKEYPRGRDWNKDAPQLAFEPADMPGAHPHWDLIMNHLGRSLNEYVEKTDWCRQWGIHTGADYIRAWIASIIRFPGEPLPYLFLYGPQNSGKSILHECIAMLFTCGVISASEALMNSSGFNGELAKAVLAYVEEKDLSKTRDTSYARLKEWTMARKLQVHVKGFTPYDQPNTLHFIQMANSPLYLPIEDGDTRITVIEVSPIPKETLIPKAKLEVYLKEEAPYFLRSLMTTNLPDSPERTRVPVLETGAKLDLERINQSPLERFAYENLHVCDGEMVKLVEFHSAYSDYCTQNNIRPDSLISVSRQLRNRSDVWTVGRSTGKQWYIGNVSLTKPLPGAKMGEALVLSSKDYLVPASEVGNE